MRWVFDDGYRTYVRRCWVLHTHDMHYWHISLFFGSGFWVCLQTHNMECEDQTKIKISEKIRYLSLYILFYLLINTSIYDIYIFLLRHISSFGFFSRHALVKTRSCSFLKKEEDWYEKSGLFYVSIVAIVYRAIHNWWGKRQMSGIEKSRMNESWGNIMMKKSISVCARVNTHGYEFYGSLHRKKTRKTIIFGVKCIVWPWGKILPVS